MSSFLEEEANYQPRKVLWTKSVVEDNVVQNPGGPEKQVHTYTASFVPEDNNGIFVQCLMNSQISETENPEYESVYIKKELVPGLIEALQNYLKFD